MTHKWIIAKIVAIKGNFFSEKTDNAYTFLYPSPHFWRTDGPEFITRELIKKRSDISIVFSHTPHTHMKEIKRDLRREGRGGEI